MSMQGKYSASDTNVYLLNAFLEWEQKNCFMGVARENNLSRPYVCSVSERYFNSRKRIMIIGQETYNFPPFNDDWAEQNIQKWGVEYLEKQLWNIGNQKYNRSAFWKLFRYIESQVEYCPCWNNVDKAHRIVNSKTVPLTVGLERSLNSTLLSDGYTILQKEIEITKPSAVLFITGPKYYQSMAAAMVINENELYAVRPTVNSVCTDISKISRLELPVLWTYHPTYLNRQEKNKKLFSQAIDIIRCKLSD